MRLVSTYLIGLLFGVGIVVSGMANPAKVLNFFDLAGHWDPSLMLVMGGALMTTLIGYRVVLRLPTPLLSKQFFLPINTPIDARLIGGSALFGLGWGIAGFCPGGAIPALGVAKVEVMIFVFALIAGLLATRLVTGIPRHGTPRTMTHRI